AFAAAGKPVAMYEKFRLDSLTAQNQQSVFETRYGANFSLGASAGLNATQLSDAYRRFGLQGSINFRQPLYDGHQRQLTRSQTRISLETIAVYRNAFDRQRQKNLDADLAQLRSLDGLLLAYDGQAEAYRRLLGYTRRLTGKGLPYSSIDVLNVVRQSKQVEMNRIQVRTNRRLAINDLNFWQE
ncbi:MAG: TolC family protein, partial [Saprospiraceae bacterium]